MGHGEYSGIEGKSGYIAPEVVRGEKQPDTLTDRYSLATLLFMLLVGDHPLEGERTTKIPALVNKFEKKIYGSMPLFIFDPNDDSNRPVRGLHRNAPRMWKYFPSFIKDAFCRSFSQGARLVPCAGSPEKFDCPLPSLRRRNFFGERPPDRLSKLQKIRHACGLFEI